MIEISLYLLIQKSAMGFSFPSCLLNSELQNRNFYQVSPRTEQRT